jgi:uncharacterized membrane protein YfcA
MVMNLELVGYLASALVGVTLGLLGAGGSILTVPILVYLFAIPPTTATTYSLLIVGITALVGVLRSMKQRQIDLVTAGAFGVPSALGVLLARAFVVPRLPETLFRIQGFTLSRDRALLLLFALLMLLAAQAMIRPRATESEGPVELRRGRLGVEGATVGILMGMVGAGGGFLIVPALVLRAGLTMRRAVATSLAIIAFNSLLGFAGVAARQAIDWGLLARLGAISTAGLFVGAAFATKVPAAKLRSAFGVFILAVGGFIVWRELGG